MDFIADLHIHSRFSRATSKDLDVESLHCAAQRKGITVLGTGDITHPGWLAEIREKLVEAGEGLYALGPDLARVCDEAVPASCRAPVRFVLTAEVSNIYKKNGATRKNHNLICFPNLEAVDKLCAKLAKIGNIHSDGRPILGLDAHDLLEMVLETGAFLIPAHIWTPWFSLLGSKSGFDSVQECFGDLSNHIFALETGLSSDPAMNWRLSQLDRFTLVSNSDAHSAARIGREANLFSTALSYPAIIEALTSGDPRLFKGTIEFFPEEGKYHLDGHRQCNQCLSPGQTRQHQGICPVCHKELTLGVLYRVEQLADRPAGQGPVRRHPFYRLVPLDEILAEILQVGTGSKAVAGRMQALLETLGNEISILLTCSPKAIAAAGLPLLEEAILRVRQGRLTISPGYDGLYGKVGLFTDDERGRLLGQDSLFGSDFSASRKKPRPESMPHQPPPARSDQQENEVNHIINNQLNPEQQAVLDHGQTPLIVVAGPGTGKTHTITCKIADLIIRGRLPADRILAMTFTQKAAREMRLRLEKRLPAGTDPPLVTTFHGFCLGFWRTIDPQTAPVLVGEEDRLALIRDAIPLARTARPKPTLEAASRFIEAAKQQLRGPADDLSGLADQERLADLAGVYAAYQDLLGLEGLMDYEDLILRTVRALETDAALAQQWRSRFTHLFVDEYQDINLGQQRLIQSLAPEGINLCVIGDPDQSIYGFRGSEPGFFLRFGDIFPGAGWLGLSRNYRSAATIVKAAGRMIAGHRLDARGVEMSSPVKGIETSTVMEAASEKAEAVMVGKLIEKMVGGTGFLAVDSGKVETGAGHRGFGDFAVIFRTHDQIRVFAEVFAKAGIPYETASRTLLMADPLVAAVLSWLRLVHGQAGFIDLQRAAGGMVPSSVFSVLKAWSLQNRWDLAKAMVQLKRFPLPGLTLSQQKRLCRLIDELETLKARRYGQAVAEQIAVIAPLAAGRLKSAPTANLETAKELARLYPDSLADLIAALALLTDTDLCRLKGERVCLLTMHAAKGMEFDVVFIAGAEEGLVPLERSRDSAEERRLFYVAMTRARQALFICHARRRRIFGQDQRRRLSPFVAAIGKDLVDHQVAAAKPQKPKGPEQLGLF